MVRKSEIQTLVRNDGWQPFPPPGPGVYDIRDKTGAYLPRIEVSRHRNGKLKCLGMDAHRTMTNCSLGYEWRLPDNESAQCFSTEGDERR